MHRLSRKDFLKKSAMTLAVGPFILRSLGNQLISIPANGDPVNCVLAPFQTGGPFYLDPEYDRSNIAEEMPGVPITLRIKVMGVTNCEPIPNAIVNIWHCAASGCYSEFGTVFGNPCDANNDKWFRGYQTTDLEGNCVFETKFPGWYPGRATHIHFDAHIGFTAGGSVDGSPDATSTFMSQMYFPDAINDMVHVQEVYTGQNPTSNGLDGIFNGEEALMVAIDDTDPNHLIGDFCIGLDMNGTPLSTDEIQGFQYFELQQNYPNPYSRITTIPFSMKESGTVTLSIFNQEGELAAQLINRKLQAGPYSVDVDANKSGGFLPAGAYVVQMMVDNRNGRFSQSNQLIIQ